MRHDFRFAVVCRLFVTFRFTNFIPGAWWDGRLLGRNERTVFRTSMAARGSGARARFFAPGATPQSPALYCKVVLQISVQNVKSIHY